MFWGKLLCGLKVASVLKNAKKSTNFANVY